MATFRLYMWAASFRKVRIPEQVHKVPCSKRTSRSRNCCSEISVKSSNK